MRNRLSPRVGSLERRAGSSPPCPTCGGEDVREYRVVFGSEEDPGPERCPRCGRRLVYTIEFDGQG